MQIAQQRIPAETYFHSDEHFNQLYPFTIQALAHKHWTQIAVAKRAARFLSVGKHVRILDIGSGVGKFCLAAAYHNPAVSLFGVEQRKSLVALAECARDKLKLENVSFIHGNFTQLDFRNYDNFYFYNSFYENLVDSNRIDDSIAYSGELYNYYNRYLYNQLEQKPSGTRIVTYHSFGEEIPGSYHLAGSAMGHSLQFWIKDDREERRSAQWSIDIDAEIEHLSNRI